MEFSEKYPGYKIFKAVKIDLQLQPLFQTSHLLLNSNTIAELVESALNLEPNKYRGIIVLDPDGKDCIVNFIHEIEHLNPIYLPLLKERDNCKEKSKEYNFLFNILEESIQKRAENIYKKDPEYVKHLESLVESAKTLKS